MAKREVIRLPLDPAIRASLEAEARSEGVDLAAILDRIAKQLLARRSQRIADDKAEQARLHAVAAKWVGSISGGDPQASQKVRETVRRRLKERHY